MLARCPSCRATFSAERTGRQECPACGKPLVVPEPPATVPGPGAGPPPDPGAGPGGGAGTPAGPGGGEPEGTPWEQRPALPALEAWKQTLLLALFEPGKLFSRARLDQGPRQLSFALWTGSIFWGIGQLLDRFLLGPQREQLNRLLTGLRHDRPLPPWVLKLIESGNANSATTTVLVALLTPAIVFFLLYANAGVTHLAALLLGQNRRGFSATFAAAAYGLAPMVLFAIPGCGPLVAVVWIAVLTGIGLKHTHGMSTGAAVGAALSPYLLLCCLTCGLVLLATSILLPALTQAGQ